MAENYSSWLKSVVDRWLKVAKPDWIERLVEEKKELDARRDLLYKFIGGEKYLLIGEEHQKLLVEQLSYMDRYSAILGRRISLIEKS